MDSIRVIAGNATLTVEFFLAGHFFLPQSFQFEVYAIPAVLSRFRRQDRFFRSLFGFGTASNREALMK
jgi:hypothetical protein